MKHTATITDRHPTNVVIRSTTIISPMWLGVIWKVLACACFASMNGIVKYLTGGSNFEIAYPLPPYVVLFFQNLFGILLILPWLISKSGIKLKSVNLKLQLTRGIFAIVGSGLFTLSLKYLPIVQVIALNFTGPIFTILGAKILLKEKLTLRKFLAILIGLVGTFIIVRPDQKISQSAASFFFILPLLSSMAFALTKLITKKLSTLGENPQTLTLYLFVMLVPGTFLFAQHNWVSPNYNQLLWLVMLGMFAGLAHYSFAKAYSLAEVTFLMPFGITKFVLSALVGFMVFNEFQNISIWIGITTIFISTGILSINKSIFLFNKKNNQNVFTKV